jgi:hypothetical protein
MTTPHVATLAQQSGINQVAFVVADLEASVRAYWDLLRIGPWTAYELSEDVLSDMTYYGKPVRFSLRHALARRGGVQLVVELIEAPSVRREPAFVYPAGEE